MKRSSLHIILLLIILGSAACSEAVQAFPGGHTDTPPAAFQTLARPLERTASPHLPSPSLAPSETNSPPPAQTAELPAATLPAASSPTSSRTPTATSTPQPSLTPLPPGCLKSGGRFETGSLETSLLKLPLAYRVYLPPCYDQSPQQRYPTLYLIHGQTFRDDQWERMGAGKTADRLIAAGEVAPFIIVMPYERYPGQPGASKFDQAMMEVLLPYIDTTYRTLADRQHRAIGGLSRGAGWAVHLGFWKAGMFSAVGAHSPAVFVNDYPLLGKWLQMLPADQAPRAYVDVGDRDRPEIIQSARELSDLLNQFNIPYEWHLFFGYHNEAYWSSHMEQYLRWYAQDW